ncbi:MAG: glutamate racemase [Verrucomicrobiales bacterium]|nr:glutamate racemase [Verrucomicrobiales bacterium]|tara:strand:- start:775 stop:1578 length:804 start_codon:yes stop_codon:yes gene_type:complete
MADATQSIGIFDSGIGGLTVVRQVRRLLPSEHLVYLGDTARVPYGTKSAETVTRFACEDAEFLAKHNVKALVVACNSASATALSELERRFSMPVFGVISPGAIAAIERTSTGRIGVIGTAATIRSQAYHRAIVALKPDAQVHARPCPLLVPLAEEGWQQHEVTGSVLKEYLAPLLAQKIDTLVLGCTHYPILKQAIADTVGETVFLVDSAESCAQFIQRELERLGLLNEQGGQGNLRLFFTDAVPKFSELGVQFLGQPAEVEQVSLL